MTGLEGKVNGVDIGDIVIISGNKGKASGYVYEIAQQYIWLTPRDPENPAWYCTNTSLLPPIGDRYLLRFFERCEVIKKKHQPIEPVDGE